MILLKIIERKYFDSFEYRCVYDITFTNMQNNEEVILTLTLGYMKYKSQLYGLNKTIKTARNNGLILNQIVKLTIKIDSSLSIINLCYYLKLPIPIMHRDFFRIISQKPEYVKTFRNDLYNPFQFACRRWISYNQSN